MHSTYNVTYPYATELGQPEPGKRSFVSRGGSSVAREEVLDKRTENRPCIHIDFNIDAVPVQEICANPYELLNAIEELHKCVRFRPCL